MLRIKDDVDLKELEKYGFTNNWSGHSNYAVRYGFGTYIEIEDRIVNIEIDAEYESTAYIGGEDINKIFDFFNSGLLEKTDWWE